MGELDYDPVLDCGVIYWRGLEVIVQKRALELYLTHELREMLAQTSTALIALGGGNYAPLKPTEEAARLEDRVSAFTRGKAAIEEVLRVRID